MKKLLFLPLLFLGGLLYAQSLEGAWKMTQQDGQPVTDKEYVKIYQDGYFAFGAKENNGNKFIGAGGGEYELNGATYTETLDFFTMDSTLVGSKTEYNFNRQAGTIVITSKVDGKTLVETWERVGDQNDDLRGNWVITGRKRDEEISRSTPGARRTVKILSGGRFQWIAFNSETKGFMGTGGGTYTAQDGEYIENIEFFSRDDKRVGAKLNFSYELIDGEWHHTGLSSTGAPIYEIWTKYKDAYKPGQQ